MLGSTTRPVTMQPRGRWLWLEGFTRAQARIFQDTLLWRVPIVTSYCKQTIEYYKQEEMGGGGIAGTLLLNTLLKQKQ